MTNTPNNPSKTPTWATTLTIVLVLLSGIIMIPIMPVLATLHINQTTFLLPLTCAAILGPIWGIRNWVVAPRKPPRQNEPHLAAAGRIGTLITAPILLLTAALLILLGIQTAANPDDIGGTGNLAISIIGFAALLALGVPLLIFQALWTWRPAVARWEHATQPNTTHVRNTITRLLAILAWLLTAIALTIPTVTNLREQTPAARQEQQTAADDYAYNRDAVESHVQTELIAGYYVYTDLHCPTHIKNPTKPGTFTCNLTSHGIPRTMHITWTINKNSGIGEARPTNLDHDQITTTTDLGQTPPPKISITETIPQATIQKQTRAALIEDGWSETSSLLKTLNCPELTPAYNGGVRCTLHVNPNSDQLPAYHYLDVRYTGDGTTKIMTAEVRDLRQ